MAKIVLVCGEIDQNFVRGVEVNQSGPIMVASFYRFVPLPDNVEVRVRIRAIGNKLGIRGSVLLAPEGINGTTSGLPNAMEAFFSQLGEDDRLAAFEKRVSFTGALPFGKFKVRLKKEIVAMKTPLADPANGVGQYVAPEDWNHLIQRPDVLVIDVRNRYETAMGTFRGSVDPKTDHFSDFVRYVDERLTSKTQTIATFCTGGIRCEKATAYLKQKGFLDVRHLKGGILSYLESVSSDQSLWEGSCFVFDEREALDANLEPINKKEPDHFAEWPRRKSSEA